VLSFQKNERGGSGNPELLFSYAEK